MHRVVSILRDHFRVLSAREFIAFLWGSLFRYERILVYSVTLQDIDCVDHPKEFPYRIVKGELNNLEFIRNKLDQLPWEFKCDLYDKVEDFFVYQKEKSGILGHISWLYYKKDPNRILRLGERECEIKFCLTLPEFRGKGLYPGTLQTIQCYLKEQGYERCFICAKKDNIASIRGIIKSGFQLTGGVSLRKILGVQISRKCDTRHLLRAEEN